jgi:hypothetical protein
MHDFLVIVGLLGVGRLCSLLPVFPREADKALSQFVIHVSLPALILVQVRRLAIDATVLAPILMPWGMLVASAGIILLAARLFHWSRASTGALLLIVPLGNTSFLGIPMVELFLGPEAIPYAVVYDQLGSFLALATYGSVIVATYGPSPTPPSAGAVMARVVSFPPSLALIVAIACRGATFPEALDGALQRLADTLVPVVMVAVGLQLRFRLAPAMLQQAAFGLAVKMLAAPALALAATWSIAAGSLAVRTSVLEAGMPPQISAGAVAIAAGLEPQLVGAMVGIGILIAPLTLWMFSALM